MRHVVTATAVAGIFITGLANGQMKSAVPPGMQPSSQVTQATPIPAPQATLGSARRISRDEAIQMVKAKKAVYVDVRSRTTYDKGHIKGAISIPLGDLLTRVREIPPKMFIITYCACPNDHSSARAVLDLNAHGIRNTAALHDGWTGWTAAGLPTEQ